ncbi:MAG: thiamine pyrophosphate-binding protein [Actinomycetota bacterium]
MAGVTGGELLVKALLEEGVRYVFGIPGGQLTTFLDAIHRVGKPRGMEFVMTRHEAAAASMADAYCRVTGEVGVCCGTVGPGALNLAAGVAAAYNDGIPMVVITPQVHSNRCYPFKGSQQQLDQLGFFRPITKWNALVHCWERIPEMVQWAFRVATSGRPGPVHLDICVDTLFQVREEEGVRLASPERYRPLVQPEGDEEALERAAKLLAGAERPLLHAGGGVLRSGAWEEVRELAEYLQMPVTTSVSARGILPEDHSLLLLPKGAGAIYAESTADVVLCVGCTMAELEYWGKPPLWGDPDAQKLIHLDIDPEIIGLNREVDVAVVGDARRSLRKLLEIVRGLTGPSPERITNTQYRQAEKEALAAVEEVARSEAKPIHPARLVREAVEFFGREAIVAVDGGNMGLWAVNGVRVFRPRSFLWSTDMGMLGTGLPFALGAKLAFPDRPVYVLHGDGAFMLNNHEVETAVRYNLPVVDIIGNDRAWGMIKGAQHAAFGDRYIGVDFSDTRYDRLAESMGAFGVRVEDPSDIRPALEEAVNSGRPAVIDAVIDCQVNLEPPLFQIYLEVALMGCDLSGCNP